MEHFSSRTIALIVAWTWIWTISPAARADIDYVFEPVTFPGPVSPVAMNSRGTIVGTRAVEHPNILQVGWVMSLQPGQAPSYQEFLPNFSTNISGKASLTFTSLNEQDQAAVIAFNVKDRTGVRGAVEEISVWSGGALVPWLNSTELETLDPDRPGRGVPSSLLGSGIPSPANSISVAALQHAVIFENGVVAMDASVCYRTNFSGFYRVPGGGIAAACPECVPPRVYPPDYLPIYQCPRTLVEAYQVYGPGNFAGVSDPDPNGIPKGTMMLNMNLNREQFYRAYDGTTNFTYEIRRSQNGSRPAPFTPPSAAQLLLESGVSEEQRAVFQVNRLGQVLALRWNASQDIVGLNLYNPQGQPGLPAGSYVISDVRSNATARITGIKFNDLGQVVFAVNGNGNGTGNANGNGIYSWLNGSRQRLTPSVTPPVGVSQLIDVSFLNHRGEMLGRTLTVTALPANQTTNVVNWVILRPGLQVVVQALTNRVSPDQTFTVAVTVVNPLREPVTNIQPVGGLDWAGEGLAEVIAGPTPPAGLTLAPGESAEFQWTLRALEVGVGGALVRFTGQHQGNPVTSALASSDPIRISIPGDLTVRGGSDPIEARTGQNQFQEFPFNEQDVSQSVGDTGVSQYRVRLKNLDAKPHRFLLRGSTNAPVHWRVNVQRGAADITAALLGAVGYPVGEIPAGGAVEFTVEFSPGAQAGRRERKSLNLRAFDTEYPGLVVDALQMTATLAEVPVTLTMHKVGADGLSEDSIKAGGTDLDAPLVPETDPLRLRRQTAIHGGLVADGVTPLLVRAVAKAEDLRAYPDGREYELSALLLKGGILRNGDLASRVRVLKDGRWVVTRRATLTAQNPEAWFQIVPLPADDVHQDPGSVELLYRVVITEAAALGDTLDRVGEITVRVRRPPVFFIHGYNTNGDWGDGFMNLFASRYERGLFLQIIRYGQDRFPTGNPLAEWAHTELVNVYESLSNLAPIARDALAAAMDPVRQDWAVTRHDVVCHSQGGLLTRMLCSQNASGTVATAFRNEDNFYRGRFHRVVTVGSPHNGTRLLRYLLKLSEFNPEFVTSIPTLVGRAGIFTGTGQAKFDPFGPQIQALNNPEPLSFWFPDSGAKFHLVRTTTGGGYGPSRQHSVLGERFLGLAVDGQPVIPAGSDGVVDYYSMAAQNAGEPPAPNTFTVNPAEWISHSGPRDAFGSTAEQNASVTVARHVLGALQQDDDLPAGVRQFGAFPLPRLLGPDEAAKIDAWAKGSHWTVIDLALAGGVARTQGGTVNIPVRLRLAAGETLPAEPGWWVEVFGRTGVTTDGVSVTPVPGKPAQAVVSVDSTVEGDVVLYCGGRNNRSELVFSKPMLVFRRPPVDLVEMELLTAFGDSVTLPVGSVLPVSLGVQYQNGSVAMIFPAEGELTVTSDRPGTVEVVAPTHWVIRSPGTARLTLSLGALTRTVTVSGYTAPVPESSVGFRIVPDGPTALLAHWPSDPPAVLQFTDSLAAPVWRPVTNGLVVAETWREVRLPLDQGQRYFRLANLTAPANPVASPSLEAVRFETGVATARAYFGATGAGALIAVLDRGIDWRNDDFRRPDGTTRIKYIFDMTDNTGANAPGNTYQVGTIYSEADINQALRGERNLPTRDAVGHGTSSAGIAAGGGRGDPRFEGVAPEADLIVVKLISDGAPAHGNQPAEAAFYKPELIPTAMKFVKEKAAALKRPCVMLLNIGSVGGPTDGTSTLARAIDATVGPGIPGLAFVSGTSDDGSATNRASGNVAANQTVTLRVHKGVAGGLTLDLWYAGDDQLTAFIRTPAGNFGPYKAPAAGGYDLQTPAPFTYYQLAPGRVFYEAQNGKRELWMSLTGPVGNYDIELTGARIVSGHFDATLNPSRFQLTQGGGNNFLTFGTSGSIWDAASAFHAIVPNSYVIATQYRDIDGIPRSITGEGALGELWRGSGVGPTFDGRYGVDVAAPGDSLFTTYAPQSYWATTRGNLVASAAGTYGRASAVSAANPIVTGVIALMMQRNPTLDALEIKAILQQSARSDSFTGATPNANWGYGKLDALEALRLTPVP